MFLDMPPIPQERLICAMAAAEHHAIPANIVLAVAQQEAGRPGQWVANRNGSFDVGAMQFNTAFLKGLARYGIAPGDIAAASCYAYELTAWRLRRHLLHDRGDLWTRISNYHSYPPQYSARYRTQLLIRAEYWAHWLERHFVTTDVYPSTSAAPPIPQSPSSRKKHPTAARTRSYVPRELVVQGNEPGL